MNKVQAYLAPKILGGQGAKSPVGGQGFPHPDQALRLAPPTLTPVSYTHLTSPTTSRKIRPPSRAGRGSKFIMARFTAMRAMT